MASVSLNQSIARVAARRIRIFDLKNPKALDGSANIAALKGCHGLAALTKMPPVHRGKVQNLVLVFQKRRALSLSVAETSEVGRNIICMELHCSAKSVGFMGLPPLSY